MDARMRALAEACLAGAEDGSLSFPQILGALTEGGFDGYLVDYRRTTATYYAADGDSVDLTAHTTEGAVAARLDPEALGEAIREAQAGGPDYSYRGFCRKAKAAGCAGYLVSISGRRVLYFGRDAATHVELFPS